MGNPEEFPRLTEREVIDMANENNNNRPLPEENGMNAENEIRLQNRFPRFRGANIGKISFLQKIFAFFVKIIFPIFVPAALQIVIFQHGIILDDGQRKGGIRRDESSAGSHKAHV